MKKLLNFNVPNEFVTGVSRLEKILDFQSCQDKGAVNVSAVKGDKNGVTLKNGEAVIYYSQKSVFFRELGVLVENMEKSNEFEIFEDNFFAGISTMIDVSRCAVFKVDAVKKLLDRLALMGYNMAMMYTEDTVKLEGLPYFGYMRGAYTKEEIREMDDYAFEYGIEMIPCLECYGHMEKYLRWHVAAPIKDTERVLLARVPKTFEFLDKLIGEVSSCYRSKKIHVGMDEAWNMGRGEFLTRNGYVEPFDIFTEYMDSLMEIIDKYGLEPMMWSDMYFRNASKNGRGYYEEDTEISKEVAAKIPENMQLVFWHYGEKPFCDKYMLKKHVSLDSKVMFAGGLWSWIGHFPEHNYALSTTKFSLEACRENNVREAMATVWLNDNAECDLFANLYGLSFFAELCFDKNASDQKLAKRFEAVSGGSAEAFYAMSYYHDSFEMEGNYPKYNYRFYGKPLFWQDIMGGLFDYQLKERPMSAHYSSKRDEMMQFVGREDDPWKYLYDFAAKVFDYLAEKTYIAENLEKAYKSGDKGTLADIACIYLPALKERAVAVHNAHRIMWMNSCNMLGWSDLDVRYAGLAARCDTSVMLIKKYLSGEIDRLTELEEERLYKPLSGFIGYPAIASVNLKT
jgi:hypothetical protein